MLTRVAVTLWNVAEHLAYSNFKEESLKLPPEVTSFIFSQWKLIAFQSPIPDVPKRGAQLRGLRGEAVLEKDEPTEVVIPNAEAVFKEEDETSTHEFITYIVRNQLSKFEVEL